MKSYLRVVFIALLAGLILVSCARETAAPPAGSLDSLLLIGSIEELRKSYGEANVTELETISGGESVQFGSAILFKDTRQQVTFTWRYQLEADEKKLSMVSIGISRKIQQGESNLVSEWTTKSGLKLGTTTYELEVMNNNRPFTLEETGNQFFVSSWHGPLDSMNLVVWFDPAFSRYDVQEISPISSRTSAVMRMNPGAFEIKITRDLDGRGVTRVPQEAMLFSDVGEDDVAGEEIGEHSFQDFRKEFITSGQIRLLVLPFDLAAHTSSSIPAIRQPGYGMEGSEYGHDPAYVGLLPDTSVFYGIVWREQVGESASFGKLEEEYFVSFLSTYTKDGREIGTEQIQLDAADDSREGFCAKWEKSTMVSAINTDLTFSSYQVSAINCPEKDGGRYEYHERLTGSIDHDGWITTKEERWEPNK